MNKEYDMQKYAPIFVDKDKATIVYNEILQLDPSNNDIEINMTGIESVTTLCAKIIFGNLAKSMGLSTFYKRIKFKGLTEEVELVINMGIDNAINSNNI